MLCIYWLIYRRVVQDGLKYPILLPSPPECWDDSLVPPYLDLCVAGDRTHARQVLYPPGSIPSAGISVLSSCSHSQMICYEAGEWPQGLVNLREGTYGSSDIVQGCYRAPNQKGGKGPALVRQIIG